MIVWYSSGGHIAKAGPFKEQIDAYRAFTLTEREHLKQIEETGCHSPYSYNLVVWPEEVDDDAVLWWNRLDYKEI